MPSCPAASCRPRSPAPRARSSCTSATGEYHSPLSLHRAADCLSMHTLTRTPTGPRPPQTPRSPRYATFCALAGVDPTDDRAAKAGLPPIDSLDVGPAIWGGQGAKSPRTEVPIGSSDNNDNSGNTIVQGLIEVPTGLKLIIGNTDPAFFQGPTYPNKTSTVAQASCCHTAAYTSPPVPLKCRTPPPPPPPPRAAAPRLWRPRRRRQELRPRLPLRRPERPLRDD